MAGLQGGADLPNIFIAQWGDQAGCSTQSVYSLQSELADFFRVHRMILGVFISLHHITHLIPSFINSHLLDLKIYRSKTPHTIECR